MSVCVCPGTITENWPFMETSTLLAGALLPQPLTPRLANAAASRMFLALLCHFMFAVSPAFINCASIAPLSWCCIPKLSHRHKPSRTLERPAYGEAEGRLRLKIVQPPWIVQKTELLL